MKIYKKNVKTIGLSLIIGMLLGTTLNFAINPATTFYVSSGSYPTKSTYVIFGDGVNYYAKDRFGKIVINSNSNASYTINAILNSLSGNDKTEVVLSGIFHIDTPLHITKSNTQLEVDASIYLNNNVNDAMLLIFSDTHIDEIKITGGYWEANRANNSFGGGFYFSNCRNVWITNVIIRESKEFAIYIDTPTSWGFEIYNNVFTDGDKSGIICNDLENSNIHDNRFGDFAYDTIQLINCEWMWINNNQLEATLTANSALNLNSANYRITIMGNIITNANYSIKVNNSRFNIISNNMIFSPTIDGIRIYSNSAYNLITSNYIQDAVYGIHEVDTSDYNNCTANYYKDCTHKAYLIGSHSFQDRLYFLCGGKVSAVDETWVEYYSKLGRSITSEDAVILTTPNYNVIASLNNYNSTHFKVGLWNAETKTGVTTPLNLNWVIYDN